MNSLLFCNVIHVFDLYSDIGHVYFSMYMCAYTCLQTYINTHNGTDILFVCICTYRREVNEEGKRIMAM